jgi:hypothetical protein
MYIHGFNRNDSEAREEFNRIQTSLIDNNYRIPLVGFSWKSNVDWKDAIINAKMNGPMNNTLLVSMKNVPVPIYEY